MEKIKYGKYRDSDSRAPKGAKPKSYSLHLFMRINPQLKAIIESEKKIGERDVDTVLRLLAEKGHTIGKLQKKVDALSQRLKIYEPEAVLNYV
jgi:uncharacterized coiled-coil protein SlyX